MMLRSWRREDVHVWRSSTRLSPSLTSDLEPMLSREERDKVARFRRDTDRQRYVAAHAMLRFVLGSSLGSAPESLAFGTGQHGKPTLEHESGLSFNLAHSGDVALLAVCRGSAVGVDVEEIRDDIDVPAMERSVFSESELRMLGDEPLERRRRLLLETWVRKEAVLKACGLGLTFEPRKLTVWGDTVGAEGTAWGLREIHIGAGYAAAVAAPGARWSLRRFEHRWTSVISCRGAPGSDKPA